MNFRKFHQDIGRHTKLPLSTIADSVFAGLARVMYRIAGVQQWTVSADAYRDAFLYTDSAKAAWRAACDHNLLPTLYGYNKETLNVGVYLSDNSPENHQLYMIAYIGAGFGMPVVGYSLPEGQRLWIKHEADQSGEITEVSKRMSDLIDDLEAAFRVLQWLSDNSQKISYVASYFPTILQLAMLGDSLAPIYQVPLKALRNPKPLTDTHAFIPKSIRQDMDRVTGMVATASMLDDKADLEIAASFTAAYRKLETEPVVLFLAPNALTDETWFMLLEMLAKHR